ncbi:TetR/AcrR family transcriptional regulator [Kribbella qitaiheensis]|uniref:TetR/AcrR family transcriptional regulator n=1 Tax=Kribbella qitaiheensis TaxID=1544730 RepID=A0A7G6WWJ6_9ACTN|nr:TetR/AcrR family transcriptional regulator [Kribbella qitaiheensis]QNE18361.1 TetR/AcrR family transcriptional regulator [Kribbella qitaiheensis]
MSTSQDLDRRGRRRQQTIDEILDVAVALMESEGVAALSLSAVARQVGMQPPSLYQYFASKMAIYDALFQRGAEQVCGAQRAARAAATTTDQLRLGLIGVTAFGQWCMENQVLSQLLFWRTVPGFEPSPEAFAPAQDMVEDLRSNLRAAVEAGQLEPTAVSEEGIALFTAMTAGLLSQQMANEPHATYEEGRFTRLMPVVVDMFYERYKPTRGKT